ncbi:MAG: tetraacyldisaccharide 4'-kinase [Zetaproteobacteria bacterium]|nr:tetraacyldisaccharide 4'-kinase [Zetaproteobacteria bacterium]
MKFNHLFNQRIERLWWHEQPPRFLKKCAQIYQFFNAHNLTQRRNCATTPQIPLISVGNITVGGSSKTPFVIWLAKELKKRDYTPVILCRAQGSTAETPVIISSQTTPQDVGDEAILLFKQTGSPVIAGRDRVLGAKIGATLGNVLILDDGFQYLQLQATCHIVLIPNEGVGNGHLIPAGPLREPIQALTRADIIVRTGEGAIQPVAGTELPHNYNWSIETSHLHNLNESVEASPPHQQVQLVAAIARPERLLKSLNKLNLSSNTRYFYSDHYNYSTTDIRQWLQSTSPVVTTHKDAVKILPMWPKKEPLWVIEQRIITNHTLVDHIEKIIAQALQSKP